MKEPDTQKYITAYEGILTQEELKQSAVEPEQFAKDLGLVKHFPGPTRQISRFLSDSAKIRIAEITAKQADKQGRDLSDVVGEVFDPAQHKSFAGQAGAEDKQDYVSKLNYQSFKLSDDGAKLDRTQAQDISGLFPQGKQDEWPTLVLVSNSNLVSPQSFFDSFQAAQKIVPAVTDSGEKVVVAGTYFSQRHLHANAVDSHARMHELGVHPASLDKVSPAAEMQAYQLLDLLLERHADGAVTAEDDKPVLRADAADVLKHVVGYGYSAAHMTNKDAFRALRDIIADGDVRIRGYQEGEPITHGSTAADADRLIPNARLIGVAGIDKMESGPQKGMPKEVDFISPNDFSMAFGGGTKLFRAPQVIHVNMRDADGNKIKDEVGGHAEDSYVRALLSGSNKEQIKTAKAKLGSQGAWRG